MKLIYIASPYRGDYEFNMEITRQACTYVMEQGLLFFAPHLYYPQILNDDIPSEREKALKMGREMILKCAELWTFGNVISEGMQSEIDFANANGIEVKHITALLHTFKNNPSPVMCL